MVTDETEMYITTYDNPYDYFTQNRLWFWYDTQILHYNTCALVSRLAHTSENLSDVENDRRINHALNDILNSNIVAASSLTDSQGNPMNCSEYYLTTPKASRAY